MAFKSAKVDHSVSINASGGEIFDYAFQNAVVGGDLKITGMEYIRTGAFENAQIGGKLYITGTSEGIEEIYPDAFKNVQMKELTISDDIKKIGDHAFEGVGLSRFVLHDVICSIGSEIFKNCIYLKTIELPERISEKLEVAVDAFPNREDLTFIVPESVTDLSKFHFENYDKAYFRVSSNLTEESPAVRYLEEHHLHYNKEDIKKAEPAATPVPTATPVQVQKNKKNFTKKKIKYKVKNPYELTAYGVSDRNIKKLVIPGTILKDGRLYKVVKIQKNAFRKLKKLTYVKVGGYVSVIGEGAFSNCTKLEQIIFGKSLKILV